MTVSKAQQKSVNKYVKENYDRINVTFPKGEKEVIRKFAEACGKSTNAYIVDAVSIAMTGTAPQENADTVSSALSAETLAKVLTHTAGSEETPTAFIDRAVSDTISRDSFLNKLKR